jgi:hypothetical protein
MWCLHFLLYLPPSVTTLPTPDYFLFFHSTHGFLYTVSNWHFICSASKSPLFLIYRINISDQKHKADFALSFCETSMTDMIPWGTDSSLKMLFGVYLHFQVWLVASIDLQKHGSEWLVSKLILWEQFFWATCWVPDHKYNTYLSREIKITKINPVIYFFTGIHILFSKY